MEQEDLGERFQKGKTKPRPNPWFGSSGDEKFHQRHPLDELTQDGEDRRGWLIIDALVQRIDNDDTWGLCPGKWIDEEVLELGNEGGVD
jgi:hypothetical protein